MKPIKTEAIIFDDGQIIIDYTGFLKDGTPTVSAVTVPVVIRAAEEDKERNQALRTFAHYFSQVDPIYSGDLFTDDVTALDRAIALAQGVL